MSSFKTGIENMPTDYFQIIISADRTLTGEHNKYSIHALQIKLPF